MAIKFMFGNRPKIKEDFTCLINIGAGFDVPTSLLTKGIKGETIINGGFAPTNGIAGRGNTYKSTITHFQVLSAIGHVSESGAYTTVECYDTENSIQPDRINILAKRIPVLSELDLVNDGVWRLKKAQSIPGDDWYKELKEALLKDKLKNVKNYMIDTPFLTDEGKPFQTIFPCFSEIDSLSHFKPSAVLEMEEKNELGDSGGNTIFMRGGLLKTRLINESGSLCGRTGHYMIMTAHIGKKFDMASGPMGPRPTKDMQFMKVDEKTKNVPEAFDFQPNIVYHVTKASLALNQDSKQYEYPRAGEEDVKMGVDLNYITLTCIRNKFGASGWNLELVVSQSEGVLVGVSDFHNLRNAKEGVKNSGAWWTCDLLPDVKFTRNSLRKTLDENPKLVRALEICHQLVQLRMYRSTQVNVPPIADIYEKLEADYGWDKLLETRGYWTFNQYEHPVPFLSSVDIVNMYHGTYVPYWWKKESKKESK